MAARKKIIANNLRKHRRLMGFSQEEVKNRLNLQSTSMISRWERGITMPSGDNLLKLSILYKTLANQLYRERAHQFQMELFPNDPPVNKKPKENIHRNRGP
jgi:transcriptional regulator with XRE-family HTH domain